MNGKLCIATTEKNRIKKVNNFEHTIINNLISRFIEKIHFFSEVIEKELLYSVTFVFFER
jgi:hypothetical protein